MSTPTLITGQVTDLKTRKGRMNFALSGGAQAAAGTAAAGAAVAGSFFSSSVLARSAMALNESAVFFTCTVNGIAISGCFSSFDITEGDTLEFVIERSPNNTKEAIAYAIRRPEERKLWIAPMMERGHGVMKRTAMFFPIFIVIFFVPLTILIIFAVSYSDGNLDAFLKHIWFILMGISGGGGLAYTAIAFGLYISTVPKAKLATQVIAALGYDEPANISLPKISENAKTQWEATHNEPFPKTDDPFCLYY